MRKSLYILAAAAALSLTCSTSQAMPMTGGAMKGTIGEMNLVEKTAVYIVAGHRYCFYFDGWHGPGWYRCGFAFRRGLGWGGVYGWRGWEYGPAARRFGRGGGVTIREGRRHRDGVTIREGGNRRGGMTVREGSTFRGGAREETTTRGRIQDGGRDGGTARGGGNVDRPTDRRGSVREGAGAGGSPSSGQTNVSPSGGEGRGAGSGGGGQGDPGGGGARRGGDKR